MRQIRQHQERRRDAEVQEVSERVELHADLARRFERACDEAIDAIGEDRVNDHPAGERVVAVVRRPQRDQAEDHRRRRDQIRREIAEEPTDRHYDAPLRLWAWSMSLAY